MEKDENKDLKELGHLNDIILTLNDQLGILGNNLIQVTNELDYLRQEYKKLLQINKELREMKTNKMGLLKF